jgi:F-type H+-transporting ATPase subunit b
MPLLVTLAVVNFALAGNVLSVDGSFLFIFVSIFVLIFLLNRTLFKPINQVLEERERLGGGRLSEAKAILARYDEQITAYEGRIRAARAESYQQLESFRREALATRAASLARAREEMAEELAVAKQEIADQAEMARSSLGGEVRQMATSISSQPSCTCSVQTFRHRRPWGRYTDRASTPGERTGATRSSDPSMNSSLTATARGSPPWSNQRGRTGGIPCAVVRSKVLCRSALGLNSRTAMRPSRVFCLLVEVAVQNIGSRDCPLPIFELALPLSGKP